MFKGGIVKGHAGIVDEFQFQYKRIFQQPGLSWRCGGQDGGWLKFEQRAEERSDLMDFFFFFWRANPSVLGSWLHRRLCMTVPCLEWSQGSCELQAGVVTALSAVMESRGTGRGKVLQSLNIHPIHFLVLLVFKENSSQPIFDTSCRLYILNYTLGESWTVEIKCFECFAARNWIGSRFIHSASERHISIFIS